MIAFGKRGKLLRNLVLEDPEVFRFDPVYILPSIVSDGEGKHHHVNFHMEGRLVSVLSSAQPESRNR